MFKKQQAFTIVETIVVILIVAVIATITVCSTLNAQSLQQKKIKAISKGFYSEAEYAYLNMLSEEIRSMNIVNINDSSFDDTQDSEELERLFEKYMDLNEVSCSNLPDNDFINEDREDGKLKCAYSNRGVTAGFYLNRDCDETYFIKEYLQDNTNPKEVNNACGYIAYATKNSKGISGVDFFMIALGKRAVK